VKKIALAAIPAAMRPYSMRTPSRPPFEPFSIVLLKRTSAAVAMASFN
jgi:hypothetical protein